MKPANETANGTRKWNPQMEPTNGTVNGTRKWNPQMKPQMKLLIV